MVGLATTIVVMNVFNAAQPALLYIVPAVIGAVLIHAGKIGASSQRNAWGICVMLPAMRCCVGCATSGLWQWEDFASERMGRVLDGEGAVA